MVDGDGSRRRAQYGLEGQNSRHAVAAEESRSRSARPAGRGHRRQRGARRDPQVHPRQDRRHTAVHRRADQELRGIRIAARGGVHRSFLPEGPRDPVRFTHGPPRPPAGFEQIGSPDRIRHRATLFVPTAVDGVAHGPGRAARRTRFADQLGAGPPRRGISRRQRMFSSTPWFRTPPTTACCAGNDAGSI